MYPYRGLGSLEKNATDKHKGIFYYLNRKKKMGKATTHLMTAQEYAKFQKILRRAHMIALARKGKSH